MKSIDETSKNLSKKLYEQKMDLLQNNTLN